MPIVLNLLRCRSLSDYLGLGGHPTDVVHFWLAHAAKTILLKVEFCCAALYEFICGNKPKHLGSRWASRVVRLDWSRQRWQENAAPALWIPLPKR